MTAKELIRKLEEFDNGQDLPVFFCNGSVYKNGLTNIGDVIADEGHYILIMNRGKYGTN